MTSSLTQRRSKEIARLKQKKYRTRYGQALVEGVRVVEAAVDAGAPVVELVVTPEARTQPRVQALLQRTDAPCHERSASDFARLADAQNAQGLLAVVETRWATPQDFFDASRVLALDGIQDPGNVGTILRTAAWFGIDAVLLGPGTADVFSPKVIRSAMGGLWDVRCAAVTAWPEVLPALRARGFRGYGADLGGTDARHWQPAAPSLLAFGSEAHGLSSAMRDFLDETITIPGSPRRQGTESLNVAVAAGVLLYAWSQAK